MGDHKDKWWAAMRKKLNVDTDDEVRQFMRESSNKSSRNSKGTGGFAYLKKHNPDKLNEVSKLGVKARGQSPKAI